MLPDQPSDGVGFIVISVLVLRTKKWKQRTIPVNTSFDELVNLIKEDMNLPWQQLTIAHPDHPDMRTILENQSNYQDLSPCHGGDWKEMKAVYVQKFAENTTIPISCGLESNKRKSHIVKSANMSFIPLS